MATTRPTIFVVDDDLAVQDSLRALLEAADLTVETYDSGQEFLQDHPDRGSGCVILDLDLPKMNGYEVLDAMAARRSHLPVILITGRPDRLPRSSSRVRGAVAFLEKPMRDDILLDAIKGALAGAPDVPGRAP